MMQFVIWKWGQREYELWSIMHPDMATSSVLSYIMYSAMILPWLEHTNTRHLRLGAIWVVSFEFWVWIIVLQYQQLHSLVYSNVKGNEELVMDVWNNITFNIRSMCVLPTLVEHSWLDVGFQAGVRWQGSHVPARLIPQLASRQGEEYVKAHCHQTVLWCTFPRPVASLLQNNSSYNWWYLLYCFSQY